MASAATSLATCPHLIGPALVSLEDVGGAGGGAGVVIAVGADDDGVSVDGDRAAEGVAGGAVGGGELGDLIPGVIQSGAALEDVGGAGVVAAVVVAPCAGDHEVAVDGDAEPEPVGLAGIAGDGLAPLEVAEP